MSAGIRSAVIVTVVLFSGIVLSGVTGAIQEIQKGKGTNPLIEEMLTLDKVFREVVSAVAVLNAARVHAAIESMHGAMERTHEGVRLGAATIPRNAHLVEEFMRLDKEFHQDIESLAHAAHENKQDEMVKLTKKLLDGCVNCHQKFR